MGTLLLWLVAMWLLVVLMTDATLWPWLRLAAAGVLLGLMVYGTMRILYALRFP